jgi:hypothetical protein
VELKAERSGIEVLVSYNPDLTIKDNTGHNVSHDAVALGYDDRMLILLDYDRSLLNSLISNGESASYIGLESHNLDGMNPLLVIDGKVNIELGMDSMLVSIPTLDPKLH